MNIRNCRLILKYFPGLATEQADQYEALLPLYREWNDRINVISRKDMDNFYERHVLHSLSIARVACFTEGTRVLDIGTGGGFPGIPLAILFPGTEFTLIDSIGKKIKVVSEVASALGLKNVKAIQGRAEELKDSFDFVVSRAVTSLPEFIKWLPGKISPVNRNPIANGLLYLKGGDIRTELKSIPAEYSVYELSSYFSEEFFATKKLVHLFKI